MWAEDWTNSLILPHNIKTNIYELKIKKRISYINELKINETNKLKQ